MGKELSGKLFFMQTGLVIKTLHVKAGTKTPPPPMLEASAI